METTVALLGALVLLILRVIFTMLKEKLDAKKTDKQISCAYEQDTQTEAFAAITQAMLEQQTQLEELKALYARLETRNVNSCEHFAPACETVDETSTVKE